MKLKKGDTVNKLTLIGHPHCIYKMKNTGYKQKRWYVNCKCECGKTKIINMEGLRREDKSKRTKDCGCGRGRIKHGRSSRNSENHATYSSWQHLKDRCLNKNNTEYNYYGGKGIEVCEKWLNFTGFLEDMGDRPRGKTIDRIDINGNYNKENCKWSTFTDQMNNTRRSRYLTYNNQKQTVAQWAKERGMNYSTLSTRLQRGWSIKRAIETK